MGWQASDGFKAVGFPILLLVVFFVAVIATQAQLRTAQANASAARSQKGLFWSAITCALLSIFLYFTSAWSYALVSTILCYALAILCSGEVGIQRFGKTLGIIQLIWFGMLIGQPQVLGSGIMADLTVGCATYYGSAAATMCLSEWLVFAGIIAGVVVGLNFLALLTLMGMALTGHLAIGAVDGTSYQTIPGGSAGDSTGQPMFREGGYQSGYVPA
jgi:hypothetical protein